MTKIGTAQELLTALKFDAKNYDLACLASFLDGKDYADPDAAKAWRAKYATDLHSKEACKNEPMHCRVYSWSLCIDEGGACYDVTTRLAMEIKLTTTLGVLSDSYPKEYSTATVEELKKALQL